MFNLAPQPIFLELGPLKLHYYGLLITAAIILGFFVSVKLAKKYGVKKNQIIDLYFYLIIAGLIGARLYHVFCEWPYYSTHPLNIVKVWNGGLGIYGAVFSGLVVIWVYSKKLVSKSLVTSYQLPVTKTKPQASTFWSLLDILSPALILGLAIGRWGNFFNQELFGLPCTHFWCIPIDLVNRPVEFAGSTHFHPTFLYESIASFLIFAILLILHKIRLNKSPHASCLMPHNYQHGSIFLTLIILYSAFRFLNEFLRIDPQPEFIGLRLSQWVSGGLFILSLTLLTWKIRKTKKQYQMTNENMKI